MNFDVVCDDDGGAQNHGNRRQADDPLAWPAIVINDVVLPYGMVDGLARRCAGVLRQLGF